MKDIRIKILKNIFAIIGFSTPLLTDLSWKYNAVFVITGLLLSAIAYLAVELYEFDNKKYLKVKGSVPGNGIYTNTNIIKIESNPNIPKDCLLTLITKGNGLTNSICMLKIIESTKGEDIQALQILPNTQNLDLHNYFADANKLDNLYATVIMKETDLETFKLI